MKIVIAPDSFKESLDALAVAKAIEAGFKRVFPHAQYDLIPMADGGEGTVQSLVDATQGRIERVSVTGPLGECVRAFFGVSGDGKTAFIEMSAASGLHLVPVAQRNPLTTTSYGTGELIKAALDQGAKHIILGLGGSATNDAGAGMLQALGVRFLDAQGRSVAWGGAALASLVQMDLSQLDARLADIRIQVACDVDNPLCGVRGASAVFGPQKGATPAQVEALEQGLETYAALIRAQTGLDLGAMNGAGASGGLGAGLVAFAGATLHPRFDIMLDYLEFDHLLAQADLVITAEGSLDGQSPYGKVPCEVSRRAEARGIPTIALAGTIGKGAQETFAHGTSAFASIVKRPCSLEEAIAQGDKLLCRAAEDAMRMMMVGQRLARHARAA